MLFISAIYGKIKPQISFTDVVKEAKDTTENFIKVGNPEVSPTFNIEKERNQNIVKRPRIRGSKVFASF